MHAQYFAPALTVFQGDGVTLDWEGNRRLYDFIVSHGVNGVVVMGSTGEFYSMTLETQKAVIDFAAKTLLGHTEVLAGTSRMNIEETIDLCQYAACAGIEKLMLISPYYFRLSQEDLEAYYLRVAAATNAKIYLYNFPARTGHSLSPELVRRLAIKRENIVGIKDTIEDFGHTRAIIQCVKAERPDFEVFTGSDEHFAHCALAGGNGCIGGLANLFPQQCAQWVEAVCGGEFAEVSRLQQFIDSAMAVYEISALYIPTLKYALTRLGVLPGETCAFPVQKLTAEEKQQVDKWMDGLLRPRE